VVRWVAENNLGYKIPGNKAQWFVDGMLLEDYLLESKI
jgi:hypothetical protein